MEYYFLAASLPPLHVGVPPDITFQEFATLVNENLDHHDIRQAQIIRRYYDIMNLRSLWKGHPLDQFGNWTEVDLEEALLNRGGIPVYMEDFLDRHNDTKERIDHFSELVALYFQNEEIEAVGFLKRYLEFERQLRLVLVALRAKTLKRDIVKELQYEDPKETLVADILAQKDAPDYDPPERFAPVKQLYVEHDSDPLELQKALSQYRFEQVEDMVGVATFSLDRILGFMVRLISILKILELDRQKGIELVDTMIEETA